jgi:hypothetical protein
MGVLKEKEEFKLVLDFSPLFFLCRLFQIYDVRERHSPVWTPVACLQCCERCIQSYEQEIAVMHQECTVRLLAVVLVRLQEDAVPR